jgi:hypothetical protein
MTHQERVAQTLAAFEAAMSRFVDRVEVVSEADGTRVPPAGGWTVAGIVWHVAATNAGFASLVDGSRPLARAPEPDFVEEPFADIAARVPGQLEAPDVFHPPADLTMAAALEKLRASCQRFRDAYRALPEERGLWTVKSILGLITVYQVGDWAVAHVARHNAQAKRVLSQVTPAL